ncbi:SAM-dependent methyltransferase [Candidatus Roizmanbacteria bacterium]|nr:SAM-dependent methyltransferase [Candidatus Roizmanbacteria bacterium]
MIHEFIVPPWPDYELLDSGNGKKLERLGQHILSRPEPKAIWDTTLPQSMWDKADLTFSSIDGEQGRWKNGSADNWEISRNNLRFIIKPTSFKHIGIFPEQTIMWDWMTQHIHKTHKPHILNLFGYTGGATLAALEAGAQVTHADASRETVTWAHENVTLSGLDNKPVRWIVDDVMTFVKREIKRNNRYDGIVMDPPKFGRGARGEVWKIERDLPRLLELCREVLSPQPLFVILSAYTVSYSSLTLANLLTQTMKQWSGATEHGELILRSTTESSLLSTTIVARWSSQ